MSKKDRKPNFKEMQAKLKESVSKNEPKFEEQKDPDKDSVKWFFLPENLRMNNTDYSWKNYNQKYGFSEFLSIEKSLHRKYFGKKWGHLQDQIGCGYYGDNLSDRQKEILGDKINLEEYQLYHIGIDITHRLFGYIKDGALYVILNDKNHNFEKEK